VVEDIAEDVKARALKYGFSVSTVQQGLELAGESAAVLGILDLTQQERMAVAVLLA
jgi:hypothetical protein